MPLTCRKADGRWQGHACSTLSLHKHWVKACDKTTTCHDSVRALGLPDLLLADTPQRPWYSVPVTGAPRTIGEVTRTMGSSREARWRAKLTPASASNWETSSCG